MGIVFRRILFIEIVIALITIAVLLTAKSTESTANKNESPTALPSTSKESSLVPGCESEVAAKSSNEQWNEAPLLNVKDNREFWTLQTNCGEIIIEVFADAAPISVNTLRFLTDEKYYDGTPCHRLTRSSFFVIQCGDPLGTGLGNPGFTIMEENRPNPGNSNYPIGTVALAKGAQPNSSGSQFFIVYKDTSLQPDYSIVGRVIVGLDIVTAIADAGILGGVQDGKPKQNFGIIEATFSNKKPKAAKFPN